MTPFLKASWINLLMANFQVDKKILEPYKPAFTELDDWNGKNYVSLVGFLFTDTEVMGFRFPQHTDFEEVNLRFYVRYKEDGEWKRGVVFIKEIVPKMMITLIANTLFHEHYVTHPMSHRFEETAGVFKVDYYWQIADRWNYLKAQASLNKEKIQPGSEEEFITEHYWGYTKVNARKTTSYEVQHPKWNIHRVHSFDMKCDTARLYGKQFEEVLAAKPTSVFLADGSEINVMNKQTIR